MDGGNSGFVWNKNLSTAGVLGTVSHALRAPPQMKYLAITKQPTLTFKKPVNPPHLYRSITASNLPAAFALS